MDLVNHTLRWPNGLTIDHVYNKLYWADAYEDNIEAMDLTTLQRKVILNQKLLIFGFLFGLSTKVNHPFGLTLLNEHIYWTDWQTDAVYRAGVNTGANVVLMTANLGKPMDIHAYSAIPKQQQRLHYTFSFPRKGSNFTCIPSRSCPQIDAPPQCPPGYNEVRENSTCGLYCRDIVGYTWRCPCNDWMSCAVKERYLWGCASGYYSSFRVRECSQDVRPGRCPNNGNQGSQNCNSDADCPNSEKCCNSKCTKPLSL
ncbi:low-density lipo receptor-related 4 isoform X1, partial [Paramuricea clavata]